MPILVLKYIFTLVPQKAPFFIRPIVNLIFGQLDKQMADPEIKKHSQLVSDLLLMPH